MTDKPVFKATLPPANRKKRDLDRYATEIGHLAIKWNDLHETLVQILRTILPSKHELDRVVDAIWHSTHNDGAQRKMLRAAVGADRTIDKTIAAEITWLLNQIDNFLTDKRNNTFHTPFIAASSDNSGSSWCFIPNFFSCSPRAQRLEGKDLLSEFKWYRDYANALAIRAHEIVWAMTFREPLPDRPSLPHLGQRRTRKAKNQKSTGKPRKPRPQS
jgi:hypothetical protein